MASRCGSRRRRRRASARTRLARSTTRSRGCGNAPCRSRSAAAPASQSKVVGVEIDRRKSLLFPGDNDKTVAQPPKIRELKSLRRSELDLSLLHRLRTLYLAPGTGSFALGARAASRPTRSATPAIIAEHLDHPRRTP